MLQQKSGQDPGMQPPCMVGVTLLLRALMLVCSTYSTHTSSDARPLLLACCRQIDASRILLGITFGIARTCAHIYTYMLLCVIRARCQVKAA